MWRQCKQSGVAKQTTSQVVDLEAKFHQTSHFGRPRKLLDEQRQNTSCNWASLLTHYMYLSKCFRWSSC